MLWPKAAYDTTYWRFPTRPRKARQVARDLKSFLLVAWTLDIVRICIDVLQGGCENEVMKPVETILTPHDALADLEHALYLQATGQRDAAFEKRVGEQTQKIQQEMLAEHGVLNVAVDLIREGRDEE